jgi:hypothetical protein
MIFTAHSPLDTKFLLRTLRISRCFKHLASLPPLLSRSGLYNPFWVSLLIRTSSVRSSSIYSFQRSVLYCTLSSLSPIICCPDFHCHPCFSVRTYSYGYISKVIHDLLKESVPSSRSDESHVLCLQSHLLFTFHVAHFRSKHEGDSGFVLRSVT